MSPALDTETLELDDSGQPFSGRYGDRYASRDGALGQARHVFLGGNELPRRWAGRRHFVILETGFGLGTNFLASWLAWRLDPQRPGRLHFVSLELHPLRREDMVRIACLEDTAGTPKASAAESLVDAATQEPCAQARAAFAHPQELLALARELAAQWPLPLPGLHRLEFDDGAVVLTLGLGDARELVTQLRAGVDAFFLDGFAPDRNPQLWSAEFLRALSRLARPDATAASYTCARPVREALLACGFEVHVKDGFASKRQMLQARYRPRWKMRRHEPPAEARGERSAIVVGAGLAGCAVAWALARRGWQVSLVERATAPAQGASGLPSGLLQPLLSLDDNPASRLTRAGFLYSRALLERLQRQALAGADGMAQGAAMLWSPSGVFRSASDEEPEEHLRRCLARHAWPAAFARYVGADEAAALLGLAPRRGGVWFPAAGIVATARWCEAMLTEQRAIPVRERPGTPPLGAATSPAPAYRVAPAWPAIVRHMRFDAEHIEAHEAGWRVTDAAGRQLVASTLVLANAHDLGRLGGLSGPPFQDLGGRVSLLRAPALSALRAGVSGDGYLLPPLLGAAGVGATYEGARDGELPLAAAHEANLARLGHLLREVPRVDIEGAFAGRRCVAADRMPLAGALVDEARARAGGAGARGAHLEDLPRRPGLYGLAALGSRGLALAPLLAEHVASLACGEPSPLERALAATVDPGRFLLRALRAPSP